MKEIKQYKIGAEFDFQVSDDIETFKIININSNENGYIYTLTNDSNYIIYKDHNQLTTHNGLKNFFKKTIKNNEERKKYEAEIIKKCVLADLTKEASVKDIAYWIWIRGAQATKEVDYIKEQRFVDAKLSQFISFNALDNICAAASIYNTCRKELPALNELKDWHSLCRLADGIRNPLLPTIYQFKISFRKKNGFLEERYVSAITFSLNGFMEKLSIEEKDILLITQYIENQGEKIVFPVLSEGK